MKNIFDIFIIIYFIVFMLIQICVRFLTVNPPIMNFIFSYHFLKEKMDQEWIKLH